MGVTFDSTGIRANVFGQSYSFASPGGVACTEGTTYVLTPDDPPECVCPIPSVTVTLGPNNGNVNHCTSRTTRFTGSACRSDIKTVHNWADPGGCPNCADTGDPSHGEGLQSLTQTDFHLSPTHLVARVRGIVGGAPCPSCDCTAYNGIYILVWNGGNYEWQHTGNFIPEGCTTPFSLEFSADLGMTGSMMGGLLNFGPPIAAPVDCMSDLYQLDATAWAGSGPCSAGPNFEVTLQSQALEIRYYPCIWVIEDGCDICKMGQDPITTVSLTTSGCGLQTTTGFSQNIGDDIYIFNGVTTNSDDDDVQGPCAASDFSVRGDADGFGQNLLCQRTSIRNDDLLGGPRGNVEFRVVGGQVQIRVNIPNELSHNWLTSGPPDCLGRFDCDSIKGTYTHTYPSGCMVTVTIA